MRNNCNCRWTPGWIGAAGAEVITRTNNNSSSRNPWGRPTSISRTPRMMISRCWTSRPTLTSPTFRKWRRIVRWFSSRTKFGNRGRAAAPNLRRIWTDLISSTTVETFRRLASRTRMTAMAKYSSRRNRKTRTQTAKTKRLILQTLPRIRDQAVIITSQLITWSRRATRETSRSKTCRRSIMKKSTPLIAI